MIEHPQGDRERPIPVPSTTAELLLDGGTEVGSPRNHRQHPIMLLSITLAAPLLVIEVLPTPCVVDARSLEVSTRIGRDPDVAPGRRDRQLTDSLFVGSRDPLTVRALKAESSAPAPTGQTESAGITTPQPHGAVPLHSAESTHERGRVSLPIRLLPRPCPVCRRSVADRTSAHTPSSRRQTTMLSWTDRPDLGTG